MSELSVHKIGPVVQDGIPYCPGPACDHLMAETAPGAYECPDQVAMNAKLRETLAPLVARLAEEPSG